jgi:puromycin-sensitive aminopeptidase
MEREADHRLARNVIPRRYDLVLEPDLDEFRFRGTVTIEIEVVEPTDTIELNAVDLALERAQLVGDGRDEPCRAVVESEAELERIRLVVPEVLEPGEEILRIEFSGILNDRLHGFYRSTYTDDEGRTRVLATTQFESTDARRAFPCWDEPDLKAVFGVTLIVPEGMMGVSCGRLVDEQPTGDGRRQLRFADTIPLSTYLLAVVVGDLEATEPVDVDGVELRILHTPGKGRLAGFALEAAAYAIRYFTEYYGIPYPGEKLDMIALPDFSAGAMENLGAITYRETLLLIDPAQATHAELEGVVATIGHEIAHMWFGDLVTMRWWNGTWLKEAFATFMEMKCTEAFRPEWKPWLGFGPTRNAAMEIDALESTRSIEFPVYSPHDADAMFDTITYEKGSAVLRMLEQYLGEATFRAGISRYLERHAYGNTDTSDLWDALEAASGEPVRAIANDWIFQGGFPQVLVDPVQEGVRLTHECFRYLGDADHGWKVPVRYRVGDRHERTLVEDAVVIHSDDPVIVNAGGSGFYRTRYAPELLTVISSQLDALDASERFALVADTWANVLSAEATAGQFLALLLEIRGEREPAIWQAALSGLDELDRIASSDDRSMLQQYTRDLLADVAADLGWVPSPGEPELVGQLRGLMLRSQGTLAADRATQREAEAVLDQWLRAPDSVDGDVASAALHIAASCGDRARFDQFISAHEAAKSPQDGVRFLHAAVAVPDPETAAELIAMVIDGRIRRQDSYRVIARLLGHRDTGPRAWREVRSNWHRIVDAMPPRFARRMLDLVHFRSEPDIAGDIEGWLAANPIRGAEQHIDQQLERLRVRVALRAREASRLAEALR